MTGTQTALQFKGENAYKDFISIILATSDRSKSKSSHKDNYFYWTKWYTFKMWYFGEHKSFFGFSPTGIIKYTIHFTTFYYSINHAIQVNHTLSDNIAEYLQ